MKHQRNPDHRRYHEIITADVFDHARTTVRFLVGSRDDDVAEVMQVASLRAYRRIGSFDHAKGTADAWFSRIARNCAIDFLRAAKRRPAKLGDDDLDLDVIVDDREPLGNIVAKDSQQSAGLLHAIEEALRRLSVEQRLVMDARVEYDAMSTHELAELLGLTDGAVKTRLSRGRAAVIAHLRQRSEEPGCTWTVPDRNYQPRGGRKKAAASPSSPSQL